MLWKGIIFLTPIFVSVNWYCLGSTKWNVSHYNWSGQLPSYFVIVICQVVNCCELHVYRNPTHDKQYTFIVPNVTHSCDVRYLSDRIQVTRVRLIITLNTLLFWSPSSTSSHRNMLYREWKLTMREWRRREFTNKCECLNVRMS